MNCKPPDTVQRFGGDPHPLVIRGEHAQPLPAAIAPIRDDHLPAIHPAHHAVQRARPAADDSLVPVDGAHRVFHRDRQHLLAPLPGEPFRVERDGQCRGPVQPDLARIDGVVDGQLRMKAQKVRSDSLLNLEVPLSSEDRFLSILVTDGGVNRSLGNNANHMDLCGLADSRFEMESLE